MNEFYIFQQELLHYLNKLPVENRRYINLLKLWLFHKIGYFDYSFARVELTSTEQTKEDHWYTKRKPYRRAMTMTSYNDVFSEL